MTLTKEKAGKTHSLKIWPEYFAGLRDGIKRAELRLNDRAYQAGDILDLCEWDPNEEAFTGEYISVTVTHVAEIGQLMPGYVLLSIAAPQPLTTSERAELENYRNAQQVVPDDAQSRELFEKWCSVNIERNKWHPEHYAHLPARDEWSAWSACRAAMLHGGKS